MRDGPFINECGGLLRIKAGSGQNRRPDLSGTVEEGESAHMPG
jgi:hypothetical protein